MPSTVGDGLEQAVVAQNPLYEFEVDLQHQQPLTHSIVPEPAAQVGTGCAHLFRVLAQHCNAHQCIGSGICHHLYV